MEVLERGAGAPDHAPVHPPHSRSCQRQKTKARLNGWRCFRRLRGQAHIEQAQTPSLPWPHDVGRFTRVGGGPPSASLIDPLARHAEKHGPLCRGFSRHGRPPGSSAERSQRRGQRNWRMGPHGMGAWVPSQAPSRSTGRGLVRARCINTVTKTSAAAELANTGELTTQ
jgi:hypothetical protein